MTEEKWDELLNHNPCYGLDEIKSKRKLSLFCLCCARLACAQITNKAKRSLCEKLVRLTEKYVDKQIDRDALKNLRHYTRPVSKRGKDDNLHQYVYETTVLYTYHNAVDSARMAFSCRQRVYDVWQAICADAINKPPNGSGIITLYKVFTEQKRIINEIVNFFHDPIDNKVLAHNNNLVTKMAQSIYDSRRHEELPLLADAMEEAGCDNTKILSHLRSGKCMHGCWALDKLLNK